MSIDFKFDDDMIDRIDELKRITRAHSREEVLMRCISLMEIITTGTENGGRAIIQYDDESKENDEIVGIINN